MIYPRHLALIPDGNRTWAKEKGLPKMIGHHEGFQRSIELSTYIFENTSIEVFTLWGLSTENLKNREDDELNYLFDIYKIVPSELDEMMRKNQVSFRWVGSRNGLPDHLIEYLDSKTNELKFSSGKSLVLAINYGGRDEIVRGINKLLEQNPELSQIDENMLSGVLDFAGLPEVELIIRTKGDLAKRLSGFMSWWAGYAQLYFTDVKCPAFDTNELKKALQWFDDIANDRNYGK